MQEYVQISMSTQNNSETTVRGTQTNEVLPQPLITVKRVDKLKRKVYFFSTRFTFEYTKLLPVQYGQ